MADENRKLKKRILRCIGILTAVWTKKGVNRNLLAREYGCSTRMISDDLTLLRDIGFPITYTRDGYALALRDLKIPPLPLHEEQILALFIASQLMVLTPLERKAEEALQNMLAVFSEDAITFLRNLTDRVYLAPGGDIGNTTVLYKVYKAVAECRPIRIRYQAFATHQEELHEVDPYGIYLKDRDHSYLVGKSYGNYQQILRFKLCRILEVTPRVKGTFTYPTDFSIRREMATGLWGGAEEYEVVIRFRPDVAQLVREREPAERIEPQPGGYLLVRQTVRNLAEVKWGILPYGAGAEVLKPKELREMMKEEFRKAWNKYRD